MKTILSTAYWPNLHYFYYLVQSDTIYLELFDHYHKQSYRNRCEILSANGRLALTIPVKHLAHKEYSGEVRVSYQENWPLKHWRAIVSAYKNSPYFEHFETEFHALYLRKPEKLYEFNAMQLDLLMRVFRLKKELLYSTEYLNGSAEWVDARTLIHPKQSYKLDERANTILSKSYYQTFAEKFPFEANLSILDLLFNKGPKSLDYFYSSPTF